MTYRRVNECDVPGCNAQINVDARLFPGVTQGWSRLTVDGADLDLCGVHTADLFEVVGLNEPRPGVTERWLCAPADHQSGDPS